MNKHQILATLALGLSLSAHAARESGGRRAPMAIEVSFSSPGNGIDSKTQDKILAIANREIRDANLTKLTVSPFGREGERTLCFEFNDMHYVREVNTEVEAIVKAGNAVIGREITTSRLSTECEGVDHPNE